MPLTFPSHAAPVLPLKLWRPRWFDGVALCAGTVTPDAGYLLRGTAAEPMPTHSLAGLIWWCLPVALVYTWIFRRTVGPVARQLPGRWRAYAGIGGHRHRLWITLSSALVGSLSHLGWDWLTHTDGWLRALVGMDFHAATGIHWWTVSDLTSTVVGGVVAVLVAARFAGRTEVVGADRSAPPGRRWLFWTVAAVTMGLGLAVLPFLPAAWTVAALGVRLLHLGAVALLLGAAAVRFGSPAQSEPRESGTARPAPAST
ncbi:DUF4184 family protein [Plantactinospora sp. GCM10030261]|uniref:DUF4184 family protein n=1 Tax=Plantactinospora sp. GCM10030261 TaxID=3273420 RepID=UPI00360C948A